jgi:hypothetical protein
MNYKEFAEQRAKTMEYVEAFYPEIVPPFVKEYTKRAVGLSDEMDALRVAVSAKFGHDIGFGELEKLIEMLTPLAISRMDEVESEDDKSVECVSHIIPNAFVWFEKEFGVKMPKSKEMVNELFGLFLESNG